MCLVAASCLQIQLANHKTLAALFLDLLIIQKKLFYLMTAKPSELSWLAELNAMSFERVLETLFSPDFAKNIPNSRSWAKQALKTEPDSLLALMILVATGSKEGLREIVDACRAACEFFSPSGQEIEMLFAALKKRGWIREALDILYEFKLTKNSFTYDDDTKLALSYKRDLARLTALETAVIKAAGHAQLVEERGILDSAPISERPIFIVSLARSGTAFIANTCARATGWPFVNPVSRTYPCETDVYTDLLMRVKNHGVLMVSHMTCSNEGLLRLVEGGIERVFVHSRDPRQATLSWSNYLNDRIKSNEIEWLRYAGLMQLPDNFRDWTEPVRLTWLVKHYFPQCINWIERWVRAADSCPALVFKLGDYKEFHEENVSYINKILNFFGAPCDINEADLPSREDKSVHFHKADPEAWRNKFNDHDQMEMSSQLSEEICERFGWKR